MLGIAIKSIFLMKTMKDVFSKPRILILYFIWGMEERPSYMELVQNMGKCQLIPLPLKKIRITIIKRFL